MLTPTPIDIISFFYPIGNTPAVCLTQDLPPEQAAHILLLGCGDVRNIIFTTYSDAWSSPRELDITCCDAEKAILARNILLFTLLVDDIDSQNDSCIWQIYYHFYIDTKSLKLLITQAAKLHALAGSVQSWHGSTYGKLVRFCDQETLDMVKQVWAAYEAVDVADQTTDYDRRFKARIQKGSEAIPSVMGTSSRVVLTGLRSAAPTCLQSLKDLPNLHQQFWTHGTTCGSGSKSPSKMHSNPMFASLETDTPILHYGSDPLLGFPLATAYAPLARDSPLRPKVGATSGLHEVTEAARTHFHAWTESFRKHSQKITLRFFAGDALAFCHTLQGRRASGDISSHWYRARYGLRPLVLDGEDYKPSGLAPLSFDIIDTSNLVDYLGSINVLTSAFPLLKDSISASLYTESLVIKETNRKELSNALLCGNFPTISIILGLVPLEYWTGITAVSTADEILFDEVSRFANNASKTNQNDPGQMHCRMTWKGAVPALEDVLFRRLHFDTRDLACVIHQLYQGMFQPENLQKAFSTPNLLTLRNNSCPTYHRGSFVSLLKYIKPLVNVDWEKMMDILLDKIEEDTTLLMGRSYIQELYVQLHCQGLYSMPPFKPGFKHEKPDHFKGGIGAWKNIPGAVCLTLQVPRANLGVFTSLPLSKLGTPFVHGVLQADTKSTFVGWQNIFADVQLAFGKINTCDARNSDDFEICVEEDIHGWAGSSPLVVSFYVPSWLVLLNPRSTAVAFGVQSTPQSIPTFSKSLGLEMTVFDTMLTNERHVYISKYAPHHSGYSSTSTLIRGDEVNAKKPSIETTVTVNIDRSTARISGITGRIENFPLDTKTSLLNGAVVKATQTSPFTMSIQIGEPGTSYEIKLPAPVLGQRNKTRIARKSSFIEVIAPIADHIIGEGFPLFMYPTYICKNRLAICNMPYLNLERLPIIDTSKLARLGWLNAHVSLQLSRRERGLRDKDSGPKDVRLNYKDSLSSMIMRFSGLHGERIRIFAINNRTKGGIQILIFTACMRLDVANHTVVLDSAVLPLTYDTMPAIHSFLEAILAVKVCNVFVDDDELRLWREVLPALVERCRKWEHRTTCEYLNASKAPISTENGEPLLCSCGHGSLPPEFITGVPRWDVAQKYAVRAAISPSFFVPYIDELIKIQGVSEEDVGDRCQKCRKTASQIGKSLLKCGRCKMVRYCSSECQRADYGEHRDLCKLSKAT